MRALGAVFAAIVWTALCSSESVAEPLKLSTTSDGYTYFNRAGADVEQHNAELLWCLGQAARVVSVDEMLNGSNVGIVGGLVVYAMSRGVRPAAIENCMVVRGWRVVRVSDDEGRALKTRDLPEIKAQIAEWIGAETPHGQIVRAWSNAAADAATDRFELRPASTGHTSLSVASLGSDLGARPSNVTPPVYRDARRVKQNRIVPPPPGKSLIVAMVRGLSFRNGIGVTLLRFNPDDESLAPSASRDDANAIPVGQSLIANNPEGNWMAFTVPAGHWRISAMGGLPALSLCMGAPAFEAREGEVIFAGIFDMGGVLGPDLNLEPARQWLAATPVASSIQPAQYSNGWTFDCGFNAIYALEIEGAPFKEGYEWGSMARSAARSLAPPDAPPDAPPVEATTPADAEAAPH